MKQESYQQYFSIKKHVLRMILLMKCDKRF